MIVCVQKYNSIILQSNCYHFTFVHYCHDYRISDGAEWSDIIHLMSLRGPMRRQQRCWGRGRLVRSALWILIKMRFIVGTSCKSSEKQSMYVVEPFTSSFLSSTVSSLPPVSLCPSLPSCHALIMRDGHI